MVRVTVKGKLNRMIIRDLFISKKTFQLKALDLFEIITFACSVEAFNMDSLIDAAYFIEALSYHAGTAIRDLLMDRLHVGSSEDYELLVEDEYDYELLFNSGFLIWHK